MTFAIENRFVGDFASWAATPGVQVLTGEFNPFAGGTDLALVNHAGGWNTVPVALSATGAAGFTIENRFVGDFASWAATPGVEALAGNFDGSGGTDLALVNHAGGWNTVPVALQVTGDGFTIQNRFVGEFADWAATPGVQVLTGRFQFIIDGTQTDLALVNHAGGWNTVPVALQATDGFTIQNRFVGEFADWAATPGVQVLTGNFDGVGGTDLALVNHAGGWNTVPVALANGAGGFTIQNTFVGDFASWAATPGVEALTGDFNGDSKTDLALVNHESGWNTVPVALSQNWVL